MDLRTIELSIGEGVSDSMSYKGASMVASSGSSEEGSGRVPTRNGLVAPAPRFKRRNVSMVWDFSPGCGRVAEPQLTDLVK
ncbi:hypothetical protein J1N35_007788 [Gossypium stocksii]|uniref:Uncharacterized protein n=1 Tax=Gossypium stocksii TaxID=47602 RepID=A0A9D3W943_9ROSI|nr:hypothetical protein J1N35_007788 [Gossypium stocksii]